MSGKHNLFDDIRTSLGIGFKHTHIQKVKYKNNIGQLSEGLCMVRIDRIYTPDLPDTLLTSKIQWDLFDSDHAAVIYEYAPSTEIERGRPKKDRHFPHY